MKTRESGATRLTAVPLIEEFHMPIIANPHRFRPYEAPLYGLRQTNSDTGLSPSVSLRIRTAARRSELTRALAEGADPTTRPELELRAAQLRSSRNRNTLARALGRIVAEARRPVMTRSRVIIIRRAEVLNAEDAIMAMIERLRSSKPVLAEGMAMAEQIIADADKSPLYNPGEPGALRRLIGVARTVMEPRPAQSHEFPIVA
jgi:hypothetical protein